MSVHCRFRDTDNTLLLVVASSIVGNTDDEDNTLLLVVASSVVGFEILMRDTDEGQYAGSCCHEQFLTWIVVAGSIVLTGKENTRSVTGKENDEIKKLVTLVVDGNE